MSIIASRNNIYARNCQAKMNFKFLLFLILFFIVNGSLLDQKEIKLILNIHNYERELISKIYNAKHYQYMTYNYDLAQDADDWNKYIDCWNTPFIHGSRDLSRPGWQGQTVGIINQFQNFTQVMNNWKTSLDKNYTQSIWPYTWMIGCSKLKCSNYIRYVCNYFPIGNVYIFNSFDEIFKNSSKPCFHKQERFENTNLCFGCNRPFAPVPCMQNLEYYAKNKSMTCIE